MAKIKLDAIDYRILAALQQNGRISNAQLAAEAGISPPATSERVKRLENAGVIRRYVALLDPQKIGREIAALISVSLSIHQMESIDTFIKAIQNMEEVLECHHVTGEEDFLLKVSMGSIAEYEDFILRKLTRIPGVNKVKSSFVLSTMKFETSLPLSMPEPDE